MALIDRKITTYAKDITTLSDNPNNDGLSATDLKAWFMGAVKEEVKATANGIIDDLTATADGASGADQIGATVLKVDGATTVQGQLEEINTGTMHLTGNQTIAGIKTFGDSPIVPTPTTDYQASTKKYADDLAAAKVSTSSIIDAITSNRTGKVVAEKAVADYSVALSNVITAVAASRTDKIISEKALVDYAISVGAGDMLKSIFDPTGKNQDIFAYADTKTSEAVAAVNQELDKIKINALLTDLQLSANSTNIDAWCDTLADDSLLNLSLSENIEVVDGKIKTVSYLEYFSGTTQVSFGTSTELYCGQTFTTPNYATSVYEFAASISKTGSPIDSLEAFLYATADGKPTGSPLATSLAVAATSLTTSLTECVFTFTSAPELSPNTLYAIAVNRNGTLDSSNYYHIGFSNFSVYADGSFIQYSSGTWGGNTSYDLNFKIYLSGATAQWNAVTSSDVLDKMAVVTTQNAGIGTITWYLSDDGTTWVEVTNLKQMYTTNFTTTSVYLKCVITGDAEVDAVAYGG